MPYKETVVPFLRFHGRPSKLVFSLCVGGHHVGIGGWIKSSCIVRPLLPSEKSSKDGVKLFENSGESY